MIHSVALNTFVEGDTADVLLVAAVDEGDDPGEELAVGVLRQGGQVVARLARGEGDLMQRLPRRHYCPPQNLEGG